MPTEFPPINHESFQATHALWAQDLQDLSHEWTDSVSCYAPFKVISKMGMNSNKLFMFHVLSTSEKWRDILSSGFLPSGIHIHQRGKPKQTTFKHVPSGPSRPIACFQNHASNQDGTWQWCSLAEENHLQPLKSSDPPTQGFASVLRMVLASPNHLFVEIPWFLKN